MTVYDLNRGDLFHLHVPNGESEVYEFAASLNSDTGNILICRIIRVAFKMDGIWYVDRRSGEQHCNPYCGVTQVELLFQSKNNENENLGESGK